MHGKKYVSENKANLGKDTLHTWGTDGKIAQISLGGLVTGYQDHTKGSLDWFLDLKNVQSSWAVGCWDCAMRDSS